jgi:hypothetical protein
MKMEFKGGLFAPKENDRARKVLVEMTIEARKTY